jgi:hypothetical protein
MSELWKALAAAMRLRTAASVSLVLPSSCMYAHPAEVMGMYYCGNFILLRFDINIPSAQITAFPLST